MCFCQYQNVRVNNGSNISTSQTRGPVDLRREDADHAIFIKFYTADVLALPSFHCLWFLCEYTYYKNDCLGMLDNSIGNDRANKTSNVSIVLGSSRDGE